MGERNFFSLLRSGFRSFRLETIMDHLRRLESPLGVTPEIRHSTDLKDRSRSEQSSNRDSPTCFVIPSEAARPNRGICIWFFLELKKGNRRSHPVHLHLQMLMWHGRLSRVCICSCLCGADALVREKQKGFQVAPGSPPDSQPIGKVCLNRIQADDLEIAESWLLCLYENASLFTT